MTARVGLGCSTGRGARARAHAMCLSHVDSRTVAAAPHAPASLFASDALADSARGERRTEGLIVGSCSNGLDTSSGGGCRSVPGVLSTARVWVARTCPQRRLLNQTTVDAHT